MSNSKIDPRMEAQLKILREMRDEDIDTSDIPEVTDWSNATRGQFSGQRHLHSWLEAIVSTAIGFIISWLTLAFIVSPIFNLQTSGSDDFIITCIFTVASVLRGYGVRRLFNYIHHREAK